MKDKQTALEWFVGELLDHVSKNDSMAIAKFWKMVEQAKAMEKEQGKQDYSVGYSNGQVNSNRTAEQYYYETYGK